MFKRKSSPPAVETVIVTNEAATVTSNAKQNNLVPYLLEINDLLRRMTQLDYVKDMLLDVGRQTEMVENIASSSEELSTTSTDISSFVHQSSQMTEDALKLSSDCMEGIGKSFDEIADAFEKSQMAEGAMTKVTEQALQIEQMVTVIKSVADQTNLLALNASIEAARAGDAGRGFAVVADEIKKLADSTKQQVDIIQNVVQILMSEIKTADTVIKESAHIFTGGKRNMDLSRKTMTNMADALEEVGKSFKRINESIDDQTASSEEIAASLSVVNEKTKTLNHETSKTGRVLNDLSRILDQLRIKMLPETALTQAEQIDICISDHLIWRWRVYNMIMGYEKLSPEQVGNHLVCRLGQWVENIGRTIPEIRQNLDSMETPHQKLHEFAKEAIIAYNNGNLGAAEAKLAEMDVVSKRIVEQLDVIKQKLK
ncbi:MAG: hypothetical protein PWP38_3018 [Clostridiales bacterium]|jgi:methyl-accepting chemotaxis protein|nr:hypothetical protein [Clostridiales bacterium]